jgi:3-hydroxypropanoate dehydrogenase
MSEPLAASALDTLFREARTYNAWAAVPITEAQIREIYELAKLGPTAANSGPARFHWVVSEAAKQRLAPHLSEGNRGKSAAASAVVIIGYDLDFPEHMSKLFPHAPDAKNWFNDLDAREIGALRNSSLQGAYLLLAARALGWDTGPMSGFDNAGVDAEFFAGTAIKSNFIMAIGKGTNERLFGRLPRLDFDEANTLL